MTGGAWPDLFIVGAMKAGTTSLWRYLDAHPDVFMSALKEPHFFSTARSVDPRAVVRDEPGYLRLFEGAAGASIRGEASTSYLWDERAPGAIAERVPEARIVIILRDPVQRAFSHYLMDYRYGHQSLGFLEALQADEAVRPRRWAPGCHLYVDLGMYHEQVRRYIRTFGERRVLVLLFDELADRPADVLARLGAFLDVDPAGFGDTEGDRVHNPFRAPRTGLSRTLMRGSLVRQRLRPLLPPAVRALGRKLLYADRERPSLPPDAVRHLAAIYEDEVSGVESLLGRRLPSLRASWGR